MTFTIPAGYSTIAVSLNNFSSHESVITWGAYLADSPGDIAAAVETVVYALPDLIQDMSSSWVVDGVRFTFEPTMGHFASVYLPVSGDLAGGEAGAVCTPNIAYLYQKQTAVIGRGGRGRFYLPGVIEDHVDGLGTVDSTFVTDATNHCVDFLDKLTTGDPGGASFALPMYVFSKGVANAVLQVSMEAKVATQRRRLVR